MQAQAVGGPVLYRSVLLDVDQVDDALAEVQLSVRGPSPSTTMAVSTVRIWSRTFSSNVIVIDQEYDQLVERFEIRIGET